MPPLADKAVEPVPPPTVEDDELVSPQAFGGGPLGLSMLPLYPYHTVRHIWGGEVKLVGFILFYYYITSFRNRFCRTVICWSLLTMAGRLLACLIQMRSDFVLLCPYLGRKTCAWSIILWSTTRCLMHRDGTPRPHHFIFRLVKYLSHSTMCRVCCIFRSQGNF